MNDERKKLYESAFNAVYLNLTNLYWTEFQTARQDVVDNPFLKKRLAEMFPDRPPEIAVEPFAMQESMLRILSDVLIRPEKYVAPAEEDLLQIQELAHKPVDQSEED